MTEMFSLSHADVHTLLLDTVEAAVQDSHEEDAWKGTPGSDYESVRSAAVPGPSGPWPLALLSLPARTCQIYLGAASAHLENLAVMLRQPAPVLSPELLVRAVVELTMRTDWILDHSVSLRVHSARSLLERLAVDQKSLQPLKRLKRDPDSPSALYTSVKRDRDEVMRLIREHFEAGAVAIDLGKGSRHWELAGQTFVTPEEMGKRFGRVFGIGEKLGEAIYGHLSGSVHPNGVSLHLRIRTVADQPLRRQLVADDEYLRKTISYALVAFGRAYNIAVSYFGWDRARFDAWWDRAASVYPDSFDA